MNPKLTGTQAENLLKLSTYPELTESLQPQLPPLIAKDLNAFELPVPGSRDELILHRFFCRQTVMLYFGGTGFGKSSASLQMAVCWSVGKSTFGIRPNGELKSLIVQAENDDGDMAEMIDGVFRGLEFSPTEKQHASERVKVARAKRRRGLQLTEGLKPLLKEFRPDILWLDPAFSYVEGDVNSAEDVGMFTRDIIDPVAEEFDCGIVIVHHTPKPSGARKKNGRLTADMITYAAAGSAEWINMARCALFLEQKDRENYVLHGAKRASRLRWTTKDGDKLIFEKIIRHSRTPGVICWEEVDMDTAPDQVSSVNRFLLLEGYKKLVLEGLAKGKKTKFKVLNDLNRGGLGIQSARNLVAELVEDQLLLETKMGRSPYLELNWEPLKDSHPEIYAKKPV